MKRFVATTAAALSFSLVAVGCGIAKDNTAASVNDLDITVDDVAKLAKTSFISQSLQQSGEGLVSAPEGTSGSASQRLALTYLVLADVYAAGVERLGGEVTDEEREAAESSISGYEQGGGKLDSFERALLVRFEAANAAWTRLVSADLTAEVPEITDADVLEYLEENAEMLGELTCAAGFAVPQAQAAAAQQAIDDGTSADDILADAALAAESLSQPGEADFCAAADAASDESLRSLLTDSPIGEWNSVEVVSGSGTFVVFANPRSRGDDALMDPTVVEQVRTQLETTAQTEADALAQNTANERFIELLESADIVIDPRFGTWDPTGTFSLIAAPTAPRAPGPLAEAPLDFQLP